MDTYRAFAPLYNFRGNFEEIELGDSLKIRKITSEEKAFLTTPMYSQMIRSFDIAFIKYTLEYTYKAKNDLERQKIPEKFFTKVILSLHLFQPGSVGITMIMLSPPNKLENLTKVSMSFGSVYKYFFGDGSVINTDKIKGFQNFWKWIKNINYSENSQLSTMIRRFEYAHNKSRLEDKFLDLVISLEAFFSEGPGDLRHKIAVRVARLLFDSDTSRKSCARSIKKIYDYRSRLAHGKTITKDPDFPANVKRAEDFLRKSIVEILKRTEKGNNREDILEYLDYSS